MRKFLLITIGILFTIFLTAPAHAINAYQGSTYLGIMPDLQCSTGLTCTRVGSKLRMVATQAGVLQPQVAATATTLTSAQCGSTFINSGAVEVELPEASTVLGCRYTFIVGNATAFQMDPDAADQIVLMTDLPGDRISADAVGESVTLEAISASQWAPVGAEKGIWTDSN